MRTTLAAVTLTLLAGCMSTEERMAIHAANCRYYGVAEEDVAQCVAEEERAWRHREAVVWSTPMQGRRK